MFNLGAHVEESFTREACLTYLISFLLLLIVKIVETFHFILPNNVLIVVFLKRDIYCSNFFLHR